MRRQRKQGGCTYSPSYAQRLSQRPNESRGIGRYNCASRGNGPRAGRANPKSERATGGEQTCAASGREQTVNLLFNVALCV
jgi:hypothetical protein